MTDTAPGTGASADPDVCYRHPGRRSFILCQRCARTICPSCQTPAAVGVHCPECTAAAKAAMPKRPPAVVRAFRRGGSTPVVTYTILALTLAVYLLQLVSGGVVTNALAYVPLLTPQEPWRMVTVALVHSSSFFHILFNMYALFVLGPLLEGLVGRGRLLYVYVLSAFAGSVAVLWLAPFSAVVGASGAIFGLFGAFFVIQRRLGGTSIQLVVILGINLVLGFVIPNVSWQAHLGGLIAGALAALIMVRTRRRDQQRLQYALLTVLAAVLVLGTVARFI